MSAVPEPKIGNIAGENHLSQLEVIKEDLIINLSTLEEGKPIKVWAKYIITCPKLLKNVNLIFVANNLRDVSYKVLLNNKPIDGSVNRYREMPSVWLPPDSIKWKNGYIPYKYTHEGLISFCIDSLSVGTHTLTVSYDAEPSEWFNKKTLSKIETFVYILKPTTQWKSFSNFHLIVFTPKGWNFFSNLNLTKTSDYTFSGYWAQLPAHHISMVVQKPTMLARAASLTFITISSLLIISLTGFILIKLIKKSQRRSIKIISLIILSLLLTLFFFLIYYKNHLLLEFLLGTQLNPLIIHGDGYFIFNFPLVWFIITILIFIINFTLKTYYIKTK